MPPAQAALDACRVLLVDDNRDSADSLGLLLHLLGAEVRVELDGATAISQAPAVMLLHLGMPGMDGLEVARRLRADPHLDGLTLIALTGWGQEQDCRAEGFDHRLVKPVDIDVLQSLLA